MSTLNPVRPGDLITAAGWNQVIDDLVSLEARVAALESGPTGPVITSTSPSGQITVPSLLTIVGRNFVTPVNGQNTVSIEGVTINTFIAGSNENMLIIDLPTFAGLPKTVQMTVSNRYGTSAPFPLQLAPAPLPPPTGTTGLTKIAQNLGTIQPSTLFTFNFDLETTLDQSEIFTLAPVITNVQGSASASDWLAASKLVDVSGRPLTQNEVGVPSGHASTTIGVGVTVPANAGSAQLALDATSQRNSALNANANPITIVTGQPYADNPKAPTFAIVPPGSQGAGIPIRVQNVNGTQVVQISFGQQNIPITVAVTTRVAGAYAFTAAIANAAGAWNPANPPVQPASFNSPSPTTENLAITVSSTATAVTTAQQTLTLTANVTPSDGSGAFTTTYAIQLGTFDMNHPTG
jgi:hypothetical protein